MRVFVSANMYCSHTFQPSFLSVTNVSGESLSLPLCVSVSVSLSFSLFSSSSFMVLSFLLYVHRNRKARDGHLDFHTAPEV